MELNEFKTMKNGFKNRAHPFWSTWHPPM